MDLSEAYKGGVVPVALLYDQGDEGEARRPLRGAGASGVKGGAARAEGGHAEKIKVKEGSTPAEKTEEEKVLHTRSSNKNSKILDIEARENDDNAKYGYGIQSRNKIPVDEQSDDLNKPFVYNIQPLSFYSTQTKEEEKILNYINKIKEIRENQMKFQTVAEDKKKPTNEETVVTVSDDDDADVHDRPILRKIQHYQTVIKPFAVDPQAYAASPQVAYPVYPASTFGAYPQPYPQGYQPAFYQPAPQPQSSVVYLPNPFRSEDDSKPSTKSDTTRIFEDYFPILINNPFNEIWAGITNIVEYGPAADVCRTSKRGRAEEDDDTEDTTEIEIPGRKIGFGGLGGGLGSSAGGSKVETWPRFAKVKVRKGGVAIAGPGGIATAGSGGTAIVGPGGTAYTTREGTAVVGPGGRVVHVPGFPVYAKGVDGSEPRDFTPPPGSKTVAEGPIVYYDNPLDSEDLPDPSLPV